MVKRRRNRTRGAGVPAALKSRGFGPGPGLLGHGAGHCPAAAGITKSMVGWGNDLPHRRVMGAQRGNAVRLRVAAAPDLLPQGLPRMLPAGPVGGLSSRGHSSRRANAVVSWRSCRWCGPPGLYQGQRVSPGGGATAAAGALSSDLRPVDAGENHAGTASRLAASAADGGVLVLRNRGSRSRRLPRTWRNVRSQG